MPKKGLNSYYYYMLDYKEAQRKKGINYRNLQEVAAAASPSWESASAEVRQKYGQIAKAEKAKSNGLSMKFTSWGESLDEVTQRQKEEADKEECERKDIRNMVMCKGFNESILKETFYVIDVNYYCRTNTKYVVCELGMVRFSLQEGIIDEYSEIINPGGIPIGYTSDAKLACAELGMELPDSDRITDYNMLLANIHEYLSMGSEPTASSKVVLPPMFTLPSRINAVQNFIYQLCEISGEKDDRFRIYKIDTLYFNLSNTLSLRSEDGFPKHSLAYETLKKDPFRHHLNIACAFHVDVNKAEMCALGRAKRWTFTILDHCCSLKGIPLVPGKHVPEKIDLDAILAVKNKQYAARSSAASSRAPSVNGSEITNPWGTYSESEGSVDRPSLISRKQLRRLARPPPNLTQESIPQLSVLGRGVPVVLPAPAAGPSTSEKVVGVSPLSLSEADFPVLGCIGRGKHPK